MGSETEFDRLTATLKDLEQLLGDLDQVAQDTPKYMSELELAAADLAQVITKVREVLRNVELEPLGHSISKRNDFFD